MDLKLGNLKSSVLSMSPAICLLSSTTVVSALQIGPFMQNKANSLKSQMNVNKEITKDYDKRTLGQRETKQSQFKANQSQYHTVRHLCAVDSRSKIILEMYPIIW